MKETTFSPGLSVWGQVAKGGMGSGGWENLHVWTRSFSPSFHFQWKKIPFQLVFSRLDGSVAHVV